MRSRISRPTFDTSSAEDMEIMVIVTHMLMALFDGDSQKVAEWLITPDHIFFGDRPIDRVLLRQEASLIDVVVS